MKKICVVGAGPAGLSAIKNSIDSKFEVIAFEKQSEIGGTWIYTDDTDVDADGVEVHSSMYQNLMTNLPKELMQFPNFPHQADIERSFVSSDKILKYLNSYSDNFGLKKFIKFQHEVIRIRPLSDEMWEVIVRNVKDQKFETFNFDFVFVCIGFSVPRIPIIPGQKGFKGQQTNSHVYRSGKIFKDEKVLVIGSGPSGLEMALEISKYAKKLFWSHHNLKSYGRLINLTLPENAQEKADVMKIGENEVHFEDGSCEEISVIAYATGYDLKFPFLSVDCGLSVEDKHVRPFYKHLFNATRPTMAILNIPYYALAFPLFDLQIRCALKFWSGVKILPTKTEMLDEIQKDENERKLQGLPKHKFHFFGPWARHLEYYEDLATFADVEKIPPVMGKMFDEVFNALFENFNIYRNYEFRIVDNENFTKTYQK